MAVSARSASVAGSAPADDGEVLVERSLRGQRWLSVREQPELASTIAQLHDLPEIVARVLASRGIAPEAVAGFLQPRLRDWLPDPSHLVDLDRAVERLVAAVRAGERIGLIGDYDVDGATSTALLRRYLDAIGTPVEVRIPDRLTDGYGPNEAAFASLLEAGCKLVLCLDSGTTAFAPLAAAEALGLEVIVVDHHSAEATLPPALALINPNRIDQVSPLGDLAAVGVVFVLLVALNRALRAAGRFATAREPDLLASLDLVALGTVCDVVPLNGLNRAFVVQGLKVARTGGTPGLASLAAVAGIEAIDDARKLGFVLGPRLNAGGRLGESGLATALLGAADPQAAEAIARRLDALNAERQALEQGTLAAAIAAVEPQARDDAPVLVAAGAGWHQGVVGIVAARLVERFARPAIVISIEGVIGIEGAIGKGSGRSRPGYDLGAAVIAARRAGLLEAGGGHPMAAGLTVHEDRIEALGRFLCDWRTTADFTPGSAELRLDGALSLGAVNLDLARKLEQLGPFGAGHPEPRFWLAAERIVQARPVGHGHVSCLLAAPAGRAVRGIAFRAAERGLDRPLLDGRPLRLAGRLRRDTWQGQERVGFEIEDAAPLT